MKHENTDIIAVVARLERQLRTVKLTLGIVVLGIAGLALTAWVAPQGDTVSAKQFMVLDADGIPRGMFGVLADQATIGMMYTDQGPIAGKAAEVLRKRSTLAPDVEIWADVMVKHAAAPHGIDARQAAGDTVERGLADAVIVSGSGTGAEPDIHEANIVKAAVPPTTRVVVGSGANVGNLSKLLNIADTVIVGSSIKVDGDANKRVDPIRAARFAQVAGEHGLL